MRCINDKIWLVHIETSDNTSDYVFSTRGRAFDLFTEIKNSIDKKFPNEYILADNVEGCKGNACYVLLESPVGVTLTGLSLDKTYTPHIIKKFKEEIKYEI